MIIFFLFWLGGSTLVGLCAKSKGRSFIIWFLTSLGLDPIIAGLLLKVMKD